MCEAVGGDVRDRGGEDGCFGGCEWSRWRWVVVGMVWADERERDWFGEGLKPGEKGLRGHCVVVVIRWVKLGSC